MFETSSLLQFLSSLGSVTVTKFLTEIYSSGILITFKNGASVYSSPSSESPVSSSREQLPVLPTVSKSDIAPWIMKAWAPGIESFHLLDQIRILSNLVNVCLSLKFQRKAIFFLRQLYLTVGNIQQLDSDTKTEYGLVSLMKQAANLTSTQRLFYLTLVNKDNVECDNSPHPILMNSPNGWTDIQFQIMQEILTKTISLSGIQIYALSMILTHRLEKCIILFITRSRQTITPFRIAKT
jgi:hypothetical protein